MGEDNKWIEWSQYVKLGIQDLKQEVKTITDKLNRIDKRLTIIEIKAGLFGGVAGLIMGIAITYLKGRG